MKKMIIAACLILVFTECVYAEEMPITVGTKIEGVTINGVYVTESYSNPFFGIRATKNPLTIAGKEIPIKDCIVMGDVRADLTVKRAFFSARKIICSNLVEPNGSQIRGYAIDSEDDKLGIIGIMNKPKEIVPPGAEARPGKPEVPPQFIEVEPHKKVTIIVTEGLSLTIKGK